MADQIICVNDRVEAVLRAALVLLDKKMKVSEIVVRHDGVDEYRVTVEKKGVDGKVVVVCF